jgi:glucan 1,3-beta-glucosidase
MLDATQEYYLTSYTSIRAASANTLQLIHDAFESLDYWNGWERPPQFQGVSLDTHMYQMFSDAVSP